uniref:Glutathione S-transferase rho n=1 Tax=Oryzias sinensis TaxID=183150 RepID=A0A8C7WSL6_9TELE
MCQGSIHITYILIYSITYINIHIFYINIQGSTTFIQTYSSLVKAFRDGTFQFLPTFKHGDTVVNESYAICLYLESHFKSQGNQLIPDGPEEQALMFQRMFEGLTFYEKLGSVIYYDWYVPEGERHDSALKRNKDGLVVELGLWEGYLSKGSGSFLAGKSFSLADVVVFPTVAFLFRFGLSAGRYPKLAEYYALLKDRPSIKASWPPHWLEGPEEELLLKDI